MTTARVALSRDFLNALSKLPLKVQKKTREFLEKFQHDPTAPGLNFERINTARDDKVRSVRIDQAYRAIVVHPPRGDVFLCAWVDKHDPAYAWAQNRVFEVNALTGAMQVFEVDEVAATTRVEPAVVDHALPLLFDDHDDETLLLAGVPPALLPSVRALGSDDDLDALLPHVPEDTNQMLVALAAGMGLAEAIEELGRADARVPTPAVDTQDFEAALERPEARATFRVVGSEAELERILDAPLAQWRVFLHPSQEQLVARNANGPMRVLGGAGTGKTVVLMHRARHLAEAVFTDHNDRLLVTTYTRTLASDLRNNLATLCEPGTAARIEVTNLHKWAQAFLQRHGHKFNVTTDSVRRSAMRMALDEQSAVDLPPTYCLDEWDAVVQTLERPSRDAYLTARRAGRGKRLSRRQRVDLWKVFEAYRRELQDRDVAEWADVCREARLLIEERSLALPYCAVLADEAQDFTHNDLRLLRALAPEGPNSLLLVGDGHQRIYGRPVTLSSCGIDVRGRSRRLKLNYRTTDQIRESAVAILDGRPVDDLDGGEDSLVGYRSLRNGPVPLIRHFATESDEADFVRACIERWRTEGVADEAICVAARTRALLEDRYAPLLHAAGVATSMLEADGSGGRNGVRLATMHRLKGIEFSRVLLVSVHRGAMPFRIATGTDETERVLHDQRERNLLYVAATRARDELAISGFGKRSSLL